MSRAAGVTAIAVDLGSTRIKAATLVGGALDRIVEIAAPPLSGEGPLREGNADDYLDRAFVLIRDLTRERPRVLPLGISSQRSTFHLWDRRSGEAATPMISWQDRRAANWCAGHAARSGAVTRISGLMLSAHYAGPKLAALQQAAPRIADRLQAGELLFGNLDCYLVWRATAGAVHETDISMAARTSMLDIDRLDWSDELLELFGVPRTALPRIVPTAGRRVDVGDGALLAAGVADQAAGALAVLDFGGGGLLVNLGTGGFILKPLSDTSLRLAGYLTSPCLGGERGVERAVLEGTINGAGVLLDRFGGPAELGRRDPTPRAFCLPDVAGLGSPYWRPEIGLRFSEGASGLDTAGQRRAATEGLLFRIRQLLEDLCTDGPSERVLLAGGVSRNPAIPDALASLLGRPVEVLDEHQAGLTGAARLAAGLDPHASPATRSVVPGNAGSYLHAKYGPWRDWLEKLVTDASA